MFEEIELTYTNLSDEDKEKIIAYTEAYIKFKKDFLTKQNTIRIGNQMPKFPFKVTYRGENPSEHELMKHYRKIKREMQPNLLDRVLTTFK